MNTKSWETFLIETFLLIVSLTIIYIRYLKLKKQGKSLEIGLKFLAISGSIGYLLILIIDFVIKR